MKISSNTGENVEMYRMAYKKYCFLTKGGAMIISSRTYEHK